MHLEDGYRGYVRNEFIVNGDFQEDGDYVVSAVIAMAYIGADLRAPSATILPFGSTVKVLRNAGEFVVCQSARYGDIYLSVDDIVPLAQKPELKKDMVWTFGDSLKRFIGVPYLWGGKSFFGFDCSGFVQVNLKFFGVDVPRDTKDQIKLGREVDKKEISAGDLLFFENHVALALSELKFIHSSLSRGGVYINSFDSSQPEYSKYFADTLQTVRRIIED